MVFEEHYYCKLLNEIDCSEEKIKEASNYMIKYIDTNNKIMVDIWFNFFKSTKLSDVKLGLFYLAHEVMFQSYILKKDKFITKFGQIMKDIIQILIQSFGQELEFIQNLIKIIEFWEKKMYFSKKFIESLRGPVLLQKRTIYEKDVELTLKESLKNEEITKMVKNNLTKQGLLLSIEQNNLKNLNEKINYEKINDLLVDKNINDLKKREISKYETKLKVLRELYINDIVKREKFLIDLVSHIEKEKDTFFDIIDKESDKNKNKGNI